MCTKKCLFSFIDLNILVIVLYIVIVSHKRSIGLMSSLISAQAYWGQKGLGFENSDHGSVHYATRLGQLQPKLIFCSWAPGEKCEKGINVGGWVWKGESTLLGSVIPSILNSAAQYN